MSGDALPSQLGPDRERHSVRWGLVASLLLCVVTLVLGASSLFLPWCESLPDLHEAAAGMRNLAIQMALLVLGSLIAGIPVRVQHAPSNGALVRGCAVLVVGLFALVAWLVTVGNLRQELEFWDPLAQYLRDPRKFESTLPIRIGLGGGVWMMLSAIAMLLTLSVASLRRHFTAVVLGLGAVGAVAALGWIWFELDRPIPQFRLSVSDLIENGDTGSESMSVATVQIQISNVANRRLILVVAAPSENTMLPGGNARLAAGRWFEPFGEPDAMLVFRQAGRDGKDKREEVARPVPLSVDGAPFLGCVMDPVAKAAVTIAARFDPIWEGTEAQPDTMSGRWTVELCTVEGKRIDSTRFTIPPARRPVEKQRVTLETEIDKATKLVRNQSARPRILPCRYATFHTYGKGLVVYRPRTITPEESARRFDENLRAFSFRHSASRH